MAPFAGYWGKVTSTIDWCEENYVSSPYIAEFWNTLSNALMIILPLVMFVMNYSHGIEKRFLACCISVTIVGIGSSCFHMTLLYYMQLLDELPMLYGCAFIIYSYLEVEKPLHHINRPLLVFLFLYCSLSTLIYLYIKTPIFFETAYGFLLIGTVLSSIKIFYYRRNYINLGIFILAQMMYAMALIVWYIDNKHCHQLRELRAHSLSSAGFLTQLHAWWHVLAALGTYFALMFVMDARYKIVKLPGKRPVTKFWLNMFPYEVMENVPGYIQDTYANRVRRNEHYN